MQEKINTGLVPISNMSQISEVQITKFHSNAQRRPVSPELLEAERECMFPFPLKKPTKKKKFFSDQDFRKKFCWPTKMCLEKARLYLEREKERRKKPKATQTCTSQENDIS